MNNKHIHKYRRDDIGTALDTEGNRKSYIIFKCVLDCTHYLTPKFILGKKAICWRCSEPFTIEGIHSKMAKPHCSDCIKRRDNTGMSDTEIAALVSVDDLSELMQRFR